MHKIIAANLATDLKTALTTYGPIGMRRVYREISKVLQETFSTQILFITPGCHTSESIQLDNAYTSVSKKVHHEFKQAYKNDHWDHLNEKKFIQAIDRLIDNLYYTLTLATPKDIYIYRSQPGSDPHSTYVTQWAGDARYGLYVKVVQIDGTEKEFDLIETYNSLS
jgi:hypothetical protein